MRYLIVLFALLSAPARALEYCDELWLTRNLVRAARAQVFHPWQRRQGCVGFGGPDAKLHVFSGL